MDFQPKLDSAANIVFAALGKRYPVRIEGGGTVFELNASWNHEARAIVFTPLMAAMLSPKHLVAAIAHETGHAELGHDGSSMYNHQTEYDADAFAVRLGFGHESISLLTFGRVLIGDSASPTHPSFSTRIARINQLLGETNV